MSAVAVDSRLARAFRFYETTVGKKVIMAATGLILFGFVIAHLLGNLQIFLGDPQILADYAHKLRAIPALLWAARITLLLAVLLHIWAAVQLARLKIDARPVSYRKRRAVGSTYASRTMYWSGPIIAAFVIYHLMHFTWGTALPGFQELRPHENVVLGFRSVPASLVYIAAMVLLGLHLHHGLWSMFQTLGVSHPRYTPALKRFAAAIALFIALGNISIPVAVMAGLIR
ncbi:MAG: succinate dehydrogenase cytochrome b subunit [Acidobacteria bacterium]|nr:succinate dehydrogenase cytochrome b subunit [Acidobacteriota bacterium]